ncbi:hypothetical protein [Actinacidiphila sp. bgisy145]|uniref:hypothetical protein n=1 Tax=Actinacidiphila sp. bgisy145 TaxID=3413792 RepID=UPI003EC0AC24
MTGTAGTTGTPTTDWPEGAAEIAFRLHDRLDRPEFAWPRTLLHYRVRWPAPAVRAADLRLLDDGGAAVPFQLTDTAHADGPGDRGALAAATVCFFADLPSGGRRTFTLRADASLPPARPERTVRVRADSDGTVVDGGALRVRLPAPGRFGAADEVPGPVLRLDRGGGWVGGSVLRRPAGPAEHLEVRLLRAGPLFADHALAYRFRDGARYTAVVRVLLDCDFLELAEDMAGLDTDGACWQLDWEGCAPTHRFSSAWPHAQDAAAHAAPGTPGRYHWLGIDEPVVVGDSGEDPPFSGPGGRERPEAAMAFTVGPYAPSYAWGIRPHATFWDAAGGDGSGGDAMGVFIRDHARWDDRGYAHWASAGTLQIRFRHDGVLHWTWPLRTGTRHTGIAFYDHRRDLDALRRQEQAGRRPAHQTTHVRDLHHWQGTLSLDRVKDWTLTYTGRRPRPLCTTGEFATPREFTDALFTGPDGPRLLANGVNEVAGYLNIGQRPLYDRLLDGYDRFADRLDPAQRTRVDALLLLTAYVSAGEEIGPTLRMLGGHPNFLADGKAALACLAWLFPEHEAAGRWLDAFEKFAELSGTFHTRPALPSRGARPGRWTESPATYVWAFLRPLTQGNALAQHADGRNRIATEHLAALGDWLVDALTAPVDVSGTGDLRRLHPAQGAHAFWPRRPPIEMRLLAEALRRYRPLTAEHLLWGSDPGARRLDSRPGDPDTWRVLLRSGGDPRAGRAADTGTNPRLRSTKYTGYGVTLRAAVDRSDEVAVFLQQVDRGPNYRWGIADDNGCGQLYYYAAGRSYSGHGPEDAGDRRVPDATFTTSCALWQDGRFRGIGPHTLDRPLYDLDPAQFAEITPDPDSPVADLYLSRSVLLVGSDYLVTYDAFAAGQRMVWTWSVLTEATGHDANSYRHLPEQLPFLHVVRGVREDGRAADGTAGGAFATDVTRGVRLEGRADGGSGNTLAVVSHRFDLTVAAARTTPWGTTVRTPHSVDHVFRYEAATHYEPGQARFARDGLRFEGTAGVIRLFDDGRRELALFHGTAVGTADVLLTTADRDLGISLAYRDPAELTGSYVAPADTAITLDLPGGLAAGAALYVDGAPVRPLERHPGALRVALPAGRHRWELTARHPEPLPPRVVRTETLPGGALVHFTPVAAADGYLLELSTDGGITWTRAARTATGPFRLTGLDDGRTYHVRVAAYNADRRGRPGTDYPVHATSAAPEPPDGLRLRLGPGTVTATWGEVLGAARYRLYRRARGADDYREVYAGPGFTCTDRVPRPPSGAGDRAGSAPVVQYAVAAENGNGRGPLSAAVDTDPASPRHWYPPGGLAFRRDHTYHRPPFAPPGTAPLPYDEQLPPAAVPQTAGMDTGMDTGTDTDTDTRMDTGTATDAGEQAW